MKALCAKSGILFKTEYFPFTDETGTRITHPVFSIPQHKLLSLVKKWAGGELKEVDSYLLFLALLDSTGQVEFRVPCSFTSDTSSIVYNNMEDLVHVVGHLNIIKHPAFAVSRIAITKENHTLANCHYWIQNWRDSISEFKEGYRKSRIHDDLMRREEALDRLIRTPHKEIQLATQIANWAEIAGSFPTFSIKSPFGEMECSEYWKLIIRKCINAESIFSVPTSDIQELIEHCEDKIEHGTIYAHTLMSMLRNGKAKQTDFLGLGEYTEGEQSFVILNPNDSVLQANLQLLIQTAPAEEPKLTEYPSRFEWLKAHSKWKLAASYLSSQSEPNKESENL